MQKSFYYFALFVVLFGCGKEQEPEILNDLFFGGSNLTISDSLRIANLSGDLTWGEVSLYDSNVKTFAIENKGNVVLSVYSVNVPSNFICNWSGQINPKSKANINITFSPTQEKIYSGNISLVSNATSVINNITLYGIGVNSLQKTLVMLGDLNFGNVAVATSVSKSVTLSNPGKLDVSVSSVVCPSGFSGSFSGLIPAGQSKTLTIVFRPTTASYYSGNINVNCDVPQKVVSLLATGTGTGALPTSIINLSGTLSYGNVIVGSTLTKTLTISNSGTSSLTISSITLPTGYSGQYSGVINAGQSVNVVITFSPTSATSYNGNLTVVSNAGSGVSTISVSGAGTSNSGVGVFTFASITTSLTVEYSKSTTTYVNLSDGSKSVSSSLGMDLSLGGDNNGLWLIGQNGTKFGTSATLAKDWSKVDDSKLLPVNNGGEPTLSTISISPSGGSVIFFKTGSGKYGLFYSSHVYDYRISGKWLADVNYVKIQK